MERAAYFTVRTWWIDLGAALRFLTRLPLPRRPLGFVRRRLEEGIEADESDPEVEEEAARPSPLGRAVRAYPIVGALIGLCAGIAFAIAAGLGLPSPVAAVIAVAVLAIMTGALHEDGLSDMADGFGSGRTAEAKLAIMRDSRIGAYGVIAIVLVLAAKVAALADLDGINVVVAGLVCAAAASRAVMPAIMRWSSPAREDGLGASAGQPAAEYVWTGIAIAALLSLIFLTWSGIIALLVCALGGYGVAWLAHRQIGGHTGDVLGAAQQVSELLFLLALAAVR
jgi:adenosylcobinamide-GDP ribazoletransferase